MISENFPTVGLTLNLSKAMVLNAGPPASQRTTPSAIPPTPESALKSPCNCPRRQTPLRKPAQLPFPAIEANRQRLQTWLLNYYRSSTFNTCEHQHLPLMADVPMRLMLDANAEPVANHTPIPLPLHWQSDVKAGLDHDVSLGVLALVPVGEPVTWCHRMVICAKKKWQTQADSGFPGTELSCYARNSPHTEPIPPGTFRTPWH